MGKDFYLLTIKDVFSTLGSGEKGLTYAEVEKRIKTHGRNTIEVEQKLSFMKLLLNQFTNYLAWLLIIIAAFAYFAGFFFHNWEQWVDGIIITFIILINALVGAFQEFKSEKSARLLKNMLKINALVIRQGQEEQINADDLVPGDIIQLAEGDKVPADCRIISSEQLKIDESMLTGESKQVNKTNAVIKKSSALAERKNLVYMNTYVTRGAATCVVIATGKDTEVGKIAKSLEIEHKSVFLEEVDIASKKITFVALAFIAIVVLIFFLKGNDWVSILMIASALVIGSIPEGLPAIVTFALAMGSVKLARSNVLVKRKTVLETLGSVDVLCTDKTGTLTKNHMTIKKLYFDGKVATTAKTFAKKTFEMFRNTALLCNEAKTTDNGIVGDAEDTSLIDFFNTYHIRIADIKKSHPYDKFEPFSSETKYCRSYHTIGKKKVIYTKGAPEIIIHNCDRILKNGLEKPFTATEKKNVLAVMKQFSDSSLRNIAFSYSKGAEATMKNSVFVGAVGIYDPPKDHIQTTIKTLYDAGIDVKMITGDNIHTASAIAKECGFRDVKAISWENLKDLSQSEFKKQVKMCNVFARMSPELKLKIVTTLQKQGKRVSITGDGVNDVAALKKAEVGISMGKRGSDIAKEASDIILLDDNLSSIIAGVKEGRTVFSNLRKVVNYLLTANLAEVFVVFVSSMFGLVPFLAIQLLWVNFVTDIAPAMALGVDPSHKDIIKKKPTGKNESIINKRITLLTIFIGLKKVIVMFAVFYITYSMTDNLALAQTMSFTWLVFSHFIRIAAIRFDERVNIFVNKYLNWSMTIPVLLQLFILYTPLSSFFHVIPLSWREWAILLGTLIISIGLAVLVTYVVDKVVPSTDKDY